MEPVRVLLVFGGDSSEHEISCLTARGVLAAVDADRFRVTCVGITSQGRWVMVPPEQVSTYQIGPDGSLPTVDPSLDDAVLVRTADGLELGRRLGDRVVDLVTVDVAFALLHGPFGEDGTIQGLFELMGVRYVGAGVLASAVCQDKVAMKHQLQAHQIPVVPFVGFDQYRWQTDRAGVLGEISALGYPLFVKPSRGGSSIGISRVAGEQDLEAAVSTAQRYDPTVVVEQGLDGVREIECAVLGDPGQGEVRVSLPGEIIVGGEHSFYDFEAKYLPGQPVSLDTPARLEPQVQEQVQDLALASYRALGVEGLARVDTFVLPTGEVLVNELNTMPGFTPTSMFPRLWEVSGLGYTDLLSTLLDMALARPLGLR
ncbi:MAG: D-alanine--D-alanine ligase family protein [Actinomycetia bacterium]|nr:D-alanine--D-alanine ligase family protein [Actinomycetes bacterium]